MKETLHTNIVIGNGRPYNILSYRPLEQPTTKIDGDRNRKKQSTTEAAAGCNTVLSLQESAIQGHHKYTR